LKLVELKAYVTPAPMGDLNLSPESILVEHEGSNYLVGEAALEQWGQLRQWGGSVQDPHYKILLKALAASILGEGEYKGDAILSAAHHVKTDVEANLAEFPTEIKFKTERTGSPWKICKLKPKEIKVKYEYAAVYEALPSVSTAAIWQVGVGDFQQCGVVNGRGVGKIAQRQPGLGYAVNRLAERLKIDRATAMGVWETEVFKGAGLGAVEINVKEIKIACIREYLAEIMPSLRMSLDQFKGSIDTIIVSGGPVKDETFWNVLKETVSGFEIVKIDKLPEGYNTDELSDPSFVVVNGLVKGATGETVAIDAGNGRLKAGWLQ